MEHHTGSCEGCIRRRDQASVLKRCFVSNGMFPAIEVEGELTVIVATDVDVDALRRLLGSTEMQ